MPARIIRTYTAFEIDGQRYERIEENAHKTERGAIAIITTWEAPCADCGETFTYKSPERPAPFFPTRRCRNCIRPNRLRPTVKTLAEPKRNMPQNEPTTLRRQAREQNRQKPYKPITTSPITAKTNHTQNAIITNQHTHSNTLSNHTKSRNAAVMDYVGAQNTHTDDGKPAPKSNPEVFTDR